MILSVLGRVWNRLTDRYSENDGDGEADCCGPEIEEIQSDAAESGTTD